MQALPKPIKVWPDSAGGLHHTVGDWRSAQLRLILKRNLSDSAVGLSFESVAQCIEANADDLLNLLTTGPTSRPGARKKAGTTNPRRAVKPKAATPEQAVAGFKAVREAASSGGTNSMHDADVPAEPEKAA